MAINPLQENIIISEIKKSLGQKGENISRYRRAKDNMRWRRTLMTNARAISFIIIGIISASFGLEGFLIPTGLIDGGVTGISLLTKRQTGLPFSVLIILFNIPFLLLGWKQIGKAFAIKSILCIAALAVALEFVNYPIVTNDKVLTAVFGGFFLGGGVGMVIRGGAVIDGTEILAIHLNRKRNISVGDFILVFNIIIFSVAAALHNIEMALYSILTYMAAARTVDFILDGIEEFTGVTIISPHSSEIADFIKEKMGRGLTIYTGKKGFGKRGESLTTDIIFTVVTRLEISRLTVEVEKIDPNAFVVMQSINDTRGGMVKKKPLSH